MNFNCNMRASSNYMCLYCGSAAQNNNKKCKKKCCYSKRELFPNSINYKTFIWVLEANKCKSAAADLKQIKHLSKSIP